MSPRTAAIDRAYKRYDILSKLVALEQDRAQANPQHQRYLNLGITAVGDTKSEAGEKLTETFDELAALVTHVAILDMTASFERLCRERIDAAASDIKMLIKQHSGRKRSGDFGSKLVKNANEFEGLRSLSLLMDDIISNEVAADLRKIRASRNSFAHGTDVKITPVVEPEQARDILIDIASRL